MRGSLLAATSAGVAILGCYASPGIAQQDTDQKFGTVHFATSCNETAQRRFDRAMRYQHSFWYRESKEIYEETLKADPECGIAYWGIALSLLNNPHNLPPDSNLPLGLAAVQKAKAVGAKTQRERDYIDALAVMYVDYDYPPIAAKGLPAALSYSKIAPNAPHAQHMPSHIFTRVGYWKESIAANTASVRAAKADKEVNDQMHGQDYLVYAYLQLGQDKNARAITDEIEAMNIGAEAFGAAFALAASPARYMVERGDWKGAAELQVRQSKFPHVMALTHYARALGAARSGHPDAAMADVAKLAELRDKLREAKNNYWAGQVDIEWQVATAWTLYAEGKYDEALKAMSAAADAEDKSEKSPVTPGPLTPARELYGFMLLDRGMAKEALAAFEGTMAKEPHRFNTYVGAARAAQMLGDKAKAKAEYQELVTLTAGTEAERPALADARAFVSSN